MTGLAWVIPINDLFRAFINVARTSQLLVVQPTIAAMIYAKNLKTGCYTGFWQVSPPSRNFNYLDFIAAQALPGPGSIINCIIQPHGPGGPTRFLTLEKQTSLSQIPGLRYSFEALANIPKPVTWEEQALTPASLQSIKLKTIGTDVYDPLIPEFQDSFINQMDKKLLPFFKFCEGREVSTTAAILVSPPEVQKLLEDHQLRP